MGLLLVVAAALLGLVHVVAPALRWGDLVPRARALSAASGASVAYVFLHLLPDLALRASIGGEAAEPVVAVRMIHGLFAVALVGFLAFYAAERAVILAGAGKWTRQRRAFRLHLGMFVAYDFIIGGVLAEAAAEGLREVAFFSLAMALHFLVVDQGLLRHHGDGFRRGRWVLAGSLLAGAGVGGVGLLPVWALTLLAAFLGGGVVLNVIKEELPREREARLVPLLLGASSYGLLLLIAAAS